MLPGIIILHSYCFWHWSLKFTCISLRYFATQCT